MDKETFDLGLNDAAIIIKQDMATEIVLPKMADEDSINFEENQNVFIILAISAAMGDEDFRAVISAKLSTMFETLEPVQPSDCDTDDPSCGGCQGCG